MSALPKLVKVEAVARKQTSDGTPARSKRNYLLENQAAIEDCRKLLLAGARPVVAGHLAGVETKCAVQLYHSIFGTRAPRGMLPAASYWYFVNKTRHAESVVFASLYQEASRLSPDARHSSLMIGAWSLFTKRNPESSLDLNRAHFLLRFIEAGEVRMAPCNRCGTNRLFARLEPRTNSCFVC